MSDEGPVRVSCGCRAAFNAPATQAGESVPCPRCGADCVVPLPDEKPPGMILTARLLAVACMALAVVTARGGLILGLLFLHPVSLAAFGVPIMTLVHAGRRRSSRRGLVVAVACCAGILVVLGMLFVGHASGRLGVKM